MMTTNTKPFCITFAGPYGCSKSPVAHYLSCELGLPILTNDAVRNEITEDTLSNKPNKLELDKRIGERAKALITRRQSFIHDASQDRRWEHFVRQSEGTGYAIGVVSFDLPQAFYRRLIAAKQYNLGEEAISKYLSDHQQFVQLYSHNIIFSITDHNFAARLVLSLAAVRRFIDTHG